MDVDGASGSTTPLEAAQGARTARRQDTDLDAADLQGARRASSRRSSRPRPAATSRPTRYEQLDLAIKAVFASWFGKRAHDYRKQPARSPHDLGHRRQRRDDGLRQHGRRLGHRRRVHARPEHRREGALRRVPDQRPGRGRRRRHPHAAEDRARCATDMPAVYAEFAAHRPAARAATTATSRTSSSRSSAAGCTCSRRASPSARPRPPCRSRSTWSTRASITKDEAVARIEPAQVDQLLRDQFDPNAAPRRRRDRQGPERLAGRGRRPGRVRRRRRRRVGRPRREGHPRPHRDLARRLPRHGRGRRASSPPAAARPRTPRSSRARSASRASPAAPSCVVDYAHAGRAQRRPGTELHAKATGSASTARPARSSSARCRRSTARFEDQPELQTGPRLGRRDPPDGGLDQRRQARGGRPGPELRRAGHRPVPDRAHVPRGRAARDRARRDPRRERRRPGPRRSAAAGETLDADDEREAVATFDAAMAKLEVLQQGDFEGIFKAMDGLPVVIRLIDPPLHEFLPEPRGAARQGRPGPRTHGGASRGGQGAARARSSRCTSRTRCSACAAAGSGLMIPDFVKIQTRAILNAQIAVKKAGGNPIAKIMIPLVGHVNELSATRRPCSRPRPRRSRPTAGVEVDYKFGTMIEVPRGALTADEIAQRRRRSSASARTT